MVAGLGYKLKQFGCRAFIIMKTTSKASEMMLKLANLDLLVTHRTFSEVRF